MLPGVKYDTGGYRQGVHHWRQGAPRNKVIVAIANKLAWYRFGRCCPAATSISISP